MLKGILRILEVKKKMQKLKNVGILMLDFSEKLKIPTYIF